MATREQTYTGQQSHEYAVNQVLTRVYTLNWEVIVYAVIIMLALITRFADLGTRVMSHDESLHTYYSWRLYEFGEFQHTPLMHGPLLFHMTALSYFLFGDSDFTARIYPAFLGVLVVAFPVLFRRWLGRMGAIFASIMLLISPELLYYSRYIRHDIPTIFFALVMVYAILQYLDGETPRRPVWLWAMAAALIGMLASKEVSFIYITLFGTFMTLYWLLRVLQDIGVQRRPIGQWTWEPPPLQLLFGHAILFGLVSVTASAMGGLLRFLLSAILWIPSDTWIVVPLFWLIYLPLALSGFVRNGLELPLWLIPGKQKHEDKDKRKEKRVGGVASAIMDGLADGKSALRILVAGAIIGALLALLIVCVMDVIKPAQVWTQTVVRSDNDYQFGANATKEFASETNFDGAMFLRLLTWIGLPVLLVLFVLFLTAVFKFPGDIPLPWREILLIILIAFIVTSFLVMVERRSFVTETAQNPFAADPNAVAHQDGERYNNNWIYAAWFLGIVISLAVAASWYYSPLWDFLNREPVFDLLIVLGTLILPWAAAYPIYQAGYNLEDYNPNSAEGSDTLRAAVFTVIPFLMVAISIGLAWNWKRWLASAAIFYAVFGFFFTTVYSNMNGLITGIIGSLGYWLEQQGVRRGSQPQYYYMLTQVPVYEFLPMIGSLLAGVSGLSALWQWRSQRTVAAIQARTAQRQADFEAEEDALVSLDERRRRAEQRHSDVIAARHDADGGSQQSSDRGGTGGGGVPDDMGADQGAYGRELDGPLDDDTQPFDLIAALGLPARLFRPFDLGEEHARRAADPEWIGAFPFLALVGYWAILITLALTMAGEKMPWLTTHIAVPLILLSGWWLGHIFEGIRWSRLREGGWLVLLVAMPLAFMGFAQVLLGFWGEGAPFRGREVDDLIASGNWLAALLVFVGALYLVGRFGNRLGWRQLGRMALLSGAVILAILTARAAYVASFINYDYATEYLVYAHAGPAVKTVMEEINRIASITNEGTNMRVVFDDESSWPYTWYFRDYTNYGFLRGEAGSVDPTSLDGARVVVVGNKKAGDVRRILGDRYYEFQYYRLWWPMQEYFNLNYDRVANVFGSELDSKYYREGIFDIWWDRDYSTYAQAMCLESKLYQCDDEANWGQTPDERKQFRKACETRLVNECRGDSRFEVSQWPVSDRMYVFVDKQLAAEVWDAGIGSSTVDIREPTYPEDDVYQDIAADAIIGDLAEMNAPRDVAVGPDGNLYVADAGRTRIVVLDPAGEVVRTIGDPESNDGTPVLSQAWGVDVGPDGTVYVADTWNHRIVVFSAEGEFIRTWGHYGVVSDDPSVDAMWGPRDVALGPDGLVYVADTGGKRVRVYTTEGEWQRDIGGAGMALGQLDEPVGLAFNPVSGNLYVAEAWNKRIQEFDPNGSAVRAFDVNMWFQNRQSPNRPYIAVSPDGTLIYVTDMDDRQRIVAYNLTGQPVYAFNQPDVLDEGILGVRNPAGLAFGPDGQLYVVDADQAKIYVFPPPEVSGNVPPVSPVEMPPGDALDDGLDSDLGDLNLEGESSDAAGEVGADAPDAIEPTPTVIG